MAEKEEVRSSLAADESSKTLASSDEQESASGEGAVTSSTWPAADDTSVQAIAIRGMHWFGMKLLFGAEFIGEIVANVLGLNESKFQYVIDGMTEEDWKIAREVQASREKEEAENANGRDVEGGEGQGEQLTLEEKIKRTQASLLCMTEK